MVIKKFVAPETSVAHIDAACIQCDLCVPECPVEAITHEAGRYKVEEKQCILCDGYYISPNCVSLCPVRAIEIISR